VKPGFGVHGRPPGGGFSVSDKARLVVLSVASLAIFASILHLVVRARTRPPEDVPAHVEPPALVARPKVDGDLLRRETRDSSPTERTELEAGPREHLLRISRNLSAAHFESAPAPDLAALERDPGFFRGEFFRMRGRILGDQAIELGPGTTPYHRGALELEAGGTAFYAVLDSADAAPGDFVRLDGVFWKIHGGSTGAPGFREGPLFVGRNLVFSFERMAPVASLDPSLLDRVRDDTAGEKEVVERDPHLHLLAYARDGVGEGDFAQAPELEGALLKDLLLDSSRFRGKSFRLFGRVQHLLPGAPDENPLRLERLTQAWVFNFQTGVQRVDFPGLVETVKPGELAWIDAYFLKNHAYEAVTGETVQVPLFVARRFERYVEPEHSLAPYLTVGALVSAGITLLVFLYALFSKEKEGGRKEMSAALASRRAARRAAAGATPPGGPPA